ncbi:MAG: glycosyltransferase family 2 protein [Planctomycetota bacterium]|nr:glycosyltransferase family 2 protein [Planctomycetota bacterium]
MPPASPMTQPAPTRADPTASRREAASFDPRGARVGVVIPAYRVAPQIERVIRGLPDWVVSIVVVEDQSPDDTAERVARLADPRVTLIRHPANRGVGGAMKTAFAEAVRQGLDVVVKMDGDDQMDPAHLPALVQPLLDGRADVVKANRYSSLGSLRGMPLVRVVGNGGLAFLVKLASGYWNVFDPANGYFAARGEALARLDIDSLPERYFFESGFLIELGIQRAVVQDVAIPARYADEHSSLSPLRVLLEFPPRLLLGLVRRVFWRYFVHDFTALSVYLLLGLPLLAWGIGFGAVEWARLHGTNTYASAGVVMLAAMPIILGAQLLLQAITLDVQNVPRTPISPPLRRPHAR